MSWLFLGQKSLNNLMTIYVSLPNMIVEDEKDLNLELFYDNGSAAV
jgi:hypothetical protein